MRISRLVAFIKVPHGDRRTDKISLNGYVVDLVKDAAMTYFKCNGILFIGQNVY
jgi:hypothetical protein